MEKTIQTLIFCFDDHRSFSEDIRKRFSDSTKYILNVSHNREDLLRSLVSRKEDKACKVALIGLNESKESIEMADKLISDIKKIDRSTGIILHAPEDKIEELRRSARINVDSYIPRNSNAILRIHNTIKKLISEHSLLIYRRKRELSTYILVAFVLVSVIFALVARFRLPMYF
jgi:hypothetical protein